MLRARLVFRHFATKSNRADIGASSEFPEGAVRKVQVGTAKDAELAIARVNGQVYAVSNSCPHYGAPMNAGYLDRYRLACPWHIAEFDVRSGEMLAGPALMSLKSFKTFEGSDGRVSVEIPSNLQGPLNAPTNSSLLAKRNPANPNHFAIVGGGASAQLTAETLRRGGFEGRITMFSTESQLPYDRTALSKNTQVDSSKLGLRPESFYSEHDIEVKLNTEVTQINANEKTIVASDGASYKFDKLCVSTGCKARIPKDYQRAYENLKNVFSIRSAADQTRAKKFLEDAQDVVIIGGSFLGLESAKSVKTKWPDKNVIVLEAAEKPLARAFGADIAGSIVEGALAGGIDLRAGVPVESIVEKGDRAVAVKAGGREIKADAILLATGAQVITSFMPQDLLREDQSVFVNEFMQTLHPDIYATGDIANFPSLLTETRQRIEHWKVAQDHGISAALNMLGQGKPYTSAPFFWTNLHINAQFVGFGYGSDSSSTLNFNPEEGFKSSKATVFYKEGKPIGVATTNVMNGPMIFKVALERNLIPRENKAAKFDFDQIKRKVQESSTCGCSLALEGN